MLGVFLVVGAATGFLLTAMLRQAAVLQAAALEGQHEILAESMSDSIKSATDFQIYQAPLSNLENQLLAPGSPAGDCLVCVGEGMVKQFYLNNTQIEYQIVQAGSVQTRVFAGVSKVSGRPIFNTDLGIVQAQWNVITTIDLVPFNVYGVPLPMR